MTGNYVSLTTFRRDGTPVPTPVWFAEHDGELLVWTGADAGKVKRVRNNGRATVRPCDVRGKVPPGAVEQTGTARLLSPDEAARLRPVMSRKYRMMRIADLMDRLLRRKRPGAMIAVRLA